MAIAAMAFSFAGCEKEPEQGKEQEPASKITADFTFDSTKEYIAGHDAVTFTNASKAEGTKIKSYYWHFGFSGEGSSSELENPAPVVYPTAGNLTVTLTVYGEDGTKAVAKKPIVITAANVPPTASFTYAPEVIGVGSEVTFTSTSTDPDGQIASLLWTLHDGTTKTEAEFKYTFDKGGSYDITLKVTDNAGATAEVKKSIAVVGENLGSGTQEDPWLIANVDKWNEIVAELNAGGAKYSIEAFYQLAGDIDFSGKRFTPIKDFKGQLDGDGKKLAGIVLADENGVDVANGDAEAEGSLGLFLKNHGKILNLTVEAEFTSNGSRVGGIAGANYGIIDGCYFMGKINCDKRGGGIAGENNKWIVNCGVLEGTVINGKGENHGGITGGNTNKHAVLANCFSWAAQVVAPGNNCGSVVGYGGSDGVVINVYGTTTDLQGGNDNNSVIGYAKKHNMQNIYGPQSKPVYKSNQTASKNTPSIWVDPMMQSVSLENMKSGAVTVPSSGESKASFVEALNAGVEIYNAWEHEKKPVGVTLRKWIASDTYPVLEK